MAPKKKKMANMTFEQTKRKKGKILFFFSKAATKKQIDSSNPIKRHWHINQAKNFVSYITGKVTVISLRISWQSEFMENSKFFVSFSSSKISLAVLISFFFIFFFQSHIFLPCDRETPMTLYSVPWETVHVASAVSAMLCEGEDNLLWQQRWRMRR